MSEFNGKVTNMKLFDRALTGDQVRNEYRRDSNDISDASAPNAGDGQWNMESRSFGDRPSVG